MPSPSSELLISLKLTENVLREREREREKEREREGGEDHNMSGNIAKN